MTSWWHTERTRGVLEVLRAQGVATVLELGCGQGDVLFEMLKLEGLEAVTGLEPDAAALERLRARLPAGEDRVTLRAGSALDPPPLPAAQAVVMVEVIEHLDPGHLSRLERTLFARLDPRLVVITTPNAELNPLLGVPAHRRRHPGHRFEWDRAQFGEWARGVAARAGRVVALSTLGGAHPDFGGASQMAVFTRPGGS